MSLKEFQIVTKLGEGAYSSVYKVKRLEDNNVYALKRVKLTALSAKQKQNALNEVRILASIRHPNVICYKQAFIDEGTKSLCIVMQFANDGDLFEKITNKQKKGQSFKQSQIWDIFIQITMGLKQLHRLQIFHRDLKSANVFLQGDRIAKLGDMNVSKLSQNGLCMTQTGTPYYASPEVWKDQPYDEKSDIWSLGCVLYEMIALKPPFRSEDMQGLYKKVIRGIYPRIPSEYSQDLSSMVRALLQTNPNSRPSCQKILKSPAVLKRIQNPTQISEKPQLLRTIKLQENIFELNGQLPKPNYVPIKVQKEKGLRNIIQTFIDTRQKTLQKPNNQVVQMIQSLPTLEKDKKIKIIPENSDRLMLVKQKQSLNMIERQRKKSQLGNADKDFGVNGQNYKAKQLKLPKVMNRYNRQRQRMNRQNSLRAHGNINY